MLARRVRKFSHVTVLLQGSRWFVEPEVSVHAELQHGDIDRPFTLEGCADPRTLGVGEPFEVAQQQYLSIGWLHRLQDFAQPLLLLLSAKVLRR